MGLFRNRPSYSPLSLPSLNTFAIPDLKVLKRDGAIINGITEVAMSNLDKTDGNFEQMAPTAALFERQLVAVFSKGDTSVVPRLGPAIAAGVQCGYMIGILENNGGVARHDQAEGHYWTALVFMALQFAKELPSEFSMEANYSFFAGYYLGRKGDIAIQELLSSVQRQLQAA
jgi:hypothetical protein